jgi:hypothetical protein
VKGYVKNEDREKDGYKKKKKKKKGEEEKRNKKKDLKMSTKYR